MVKISNLNKYSTFSVAKSLEILSRTFCRLVVIEILLHAYFECFLDIVMKHT